MNEKNYSFNFKSDYENILQQELTQQYIDMYGVDIYYLPKKEYEASDINVVFQEVKNKVYNNVYRMRMLLEDSILSQNMDIFSKFGLEIQDECTLYITMKEYYERLTGDYTDPSNGMYEIDNTKADDYRAYKPEISDIIHMPMYESMFEVSYVEYQENMVHQLPTSWKIVCKKISLDENEHIDITQTGYGEPIDINAQDSEFQEFINEINEIGEIAGEKTDIDMDVDHVDPTQTGGLQTGDETEEEVIERVQSTEILNDDYEKEAKDTIRDDSDDENPFNSPFF